MESHCRVCAAESTSLTSAFSIISDRLVLDMIHAVCPIEIKISDKMPKGVCSLCLKIINDAFNLRKVSVKSDLHFRRLRLSVATTSKVGSSKKNQVNNENVVENHESALENHQNELEVPQNELKVQQNQQEIHQNQQEIHQNELDIPQSEQDLTENDLNPSQIPIKIKSEKPDVDSSISVIDYDPKDIPCSEAYSSANESYHSDYEITSYEPSTAKKVKTENSSDQRLHHFRHRQLNDKVKGFFKEPKEKGGKSKCKLCNKLYSGDVQNLKDHLVAVHAHIAKPLGIIKRPPRTKRNFSNVFDNSDGLDHFLFVNNKTEDIQAIPKEEQEDCKASIRIFEVNSQVNEQMMDDSSASSSTYNNREYNQIVNDRVRDFFKRNNRTEKWLCKLCRREYTGGIIDLKDHLSSSHNDIAVSLGLKETFKRRR